MTQWVWGTSLSYSDYLQAKSFEQSVTSTISRSARETIATIEETSERSSAEVRSIAEGIEEIGFATVQIERGLSELGVTFSWGFSELLIEVGRMNDSLDALVQTARTPTQTWAYEQYAIARDALRRGLHNEALLCAHRAIEGFGSNPGYRLD